MPGMMGTSGGQDALRRAAMQYAGNGAPQGAPAPGASPQAAGGQGTIETLLQQAIRMTANQPQLIQQNIAAWKQAWLMLDGILKEVRGGQQPGQPAAPPPQGMGTAGAQAGMPNVGRPPI